VATLGCFGLPCSSGGSSASARRLQRQINESPGLPDELRRKLATVLAKEFSRKVRAACVCRPVGRCLPCKLSGRQGKVRRAMPSASASIWVLLEGRA
jgi:hypothetical protein